MGGSSNPTTTAGGAASRSTPGGGAGGAAGGGSDGGTPACPAELPASVAGPEAALLPAPNDVLEVTLDASSPPPRVLVVDPVGGGVVGSLAGVPGLATLIACLRAGVAYRAVVHAVDGGRVDLVLRRMD